MTLPRTVRYIGAAVVGALIAAPIAFWFGARLGVSEFELADAKYKASILAFDIARLQRQDSATVESIMQISLNGQLANHGRYLKSNWHWLFPQMEAPDDRAIRHAAKFRIDHPFEDPDLSLPSGWNPGISMTDPFVLEVIEGQRENRALVQTVLAKYGN